jgi:hypothetical protein
MKDLEKELFEELFEQKLCLDFQNKSTVLDK